MIHIIASEDTNVDVDSTYRSILRTLESNGCELYDCGACDHYHDIYDDTKSEKYLDEIRKEVLDTHTVRSSEISRASGCPSVLYLIL